MKSLPLIILFLLTYFASGVDIEEQLDAAQTISHFGYPAERHYVKTDDGYTSEIQRIPVGKDARPIPDCSKKRPVVFFMHGLFASSHEFISNLPSQSAPFVFADAGFDVWLGNVRGTEYGLNHTSWTPEQPEFWNFTLYEYSHFDLRQQIDYVLEVTKQKSLFYVGHSQGTTVMFARLAEADATWQSKIRMFFAMGPTAGFLKPFMPLSLLEKEYMQNLVQFALDGKFGIVPVTIPKTITSAISNFCSSEFWSHVCSAGFRIAVGLEKLGQFNMSRLPVFISHFPSKTSTLNVLHWMQIFKFHELRRLDLGVRRNLIAYGQEDAPKLDIGKITARTVLYFSNDDKVTDAIDVRDILIKHMGPGLIEYHDLDHFSHIDFAVGLRATDDVYKPIVRRIYKDINEKGC